MAELVLPFFLYNGGTGFLKHTPLQLLGNLILMNLIQDSIPRESPTTFLLTNNNSRTGTFFFFHNGETGTFDFLKSKNQIAIVSYHAHTI